MAAGWQVTRLARRVLRTQCGLRAADTGADLRKHAFLSGS